LNTLEAKGNTVRNPYNRENISERRQYFDHEFHDYSHEEGYFTDRPVSWFTDNILPDLLENVENTDNILDVGCASGYYTAKMSEHFDLVYGVDYCEPRINYAKSLESEKLKFRLCNLTKLEDLQALGYKFKNLFSNAVLPHIPLADKKIVFDNLAEISEEGASFIFYDARETFEVQDVFVGTFNENFIINNIQSWNFISVKQVAHFDHPNGTHRYILKKR